MSIYAVARREDSLTKQYFATSTYLTLSRIFSEPFLIEMVSFQPLSTEKEPRSMWFGKRIQSLLRLSEWLKDSKGNQSHF